MMLESFIKGLLAITVGELGDKTFFIAVILAMSNPRKLVFTGVIGALVSMTILSVLIGQTIANIVPQIYVHFGEIFLFTVFGLKLLYDGMKMKESKQSEGEEEALLTLEKTQKKTGIWGVIVQAFVLTFIAEWGDRTQITTIALATSNTVLPVTLGAIMGHIIAAAIAVLGGRLIPGHISEKKITLIGGLLFLIFAIVAVIK
jgi:Ca2+/H+ antiporter, TMEM165/GDT1 family